MKLIYAENVAKNLKAMKESLGCNAIWIDTMIDGLLTKEPAVDAELVRHGHWTDGDNCSICEFQTTQKTRNYCPRCGAKMDEVSE